jgi:hypothetical protein
MIYLARMTLIDAEDQCLISNDDKIYNKRPEDCASLCYQSDDCIYWVWEDIYYYILERKLKPQFCKCKNSDNYCNYPKWEDDNVCFLSMMISHNICHIRTKNEQLTFEKFAAEKNACQDWCQKYNYVDCPLSWKTCSQDQDCSQDIENQICECFF